MLPLSIRMNFAALVFIVLVPLVYGQERQISSKLNPGCAKCKTDDTLVYIKAKGSNDTIHQVWDFTGGIPTVIFAVASVNSTLNVTWDGTVPREFVFNEEPKYTFGMAVDKVIEYDDVTDSGHIDPSMPQRDFLLRRVNWRRNTTSLSDKEAMVVLRGRFRDHRGRLEMKLDLLPFKDYAVELPHLIHTANSTLIDVSLVNLTQSREYNASRFALHFILASSDSSTDTMRYLMRKSLDDEHTPGVFEIMEIKTPESYLRGDGGFMQFRPVAYTQPQRGVASSTIAHMTNFISTPLPQQSTLGTFYSGQNPTNLLVQAMFMSFGEPGDGYYKQHNYTAWSFTIGYGAPPLESFSLFVIVIISIGLGAPVALALSGVTYVLVRRYRTRNAPARFTDDD